MRKLTVLSFCIVLVLGMSIGKAAMAASNEEEALRVETNFAKAINSGDYDLMSSLFWHSSKVSTFQPGTNPFLCQGWEESLNPNWKSSLSGTSTTTITPHNWQATFIKDDVAIITGYENVASINEMTKEETITNLRVTRVLQKIRGKWLIVHDHGSELPLE